jgi:HEPN domain-containing protein
LEIICYHCQQAAEKAIKAIVVSKGTQGGMPKLHDLSFLLNQVKNFVEIEEKYFDYADALTPYGVAVRYPNELFLEEHHARNAIRYADEIVQWVYGVIGDESDK